MNKERRKRLTGAIARLQEIEGVLEVTRDEEQEAFDNSPIGFQNGERGDAMQVAISAMEEALMALPEVISLLEDAVNG